MKNICIVIDNISLSAGTERAVCNLANLLESSRKYHVVITSLFSEKKAEASYPLEKTVEIVNLGLSNANAVKRFRSYLKFVSIMNSQYANVYDVIIGTTYALNSLLPKIRTKSRRVGCAHLNYDSCPAYSKVLRKILYPKLDAVVLLTKADKQHYVRFLDQKKLFVIPNSVSFSSNVTSSLDSKRIIALGRLTAQKGFDYLLEVAAILKKQLPDWHVDVFGEGDDRRELEEQSIKLGVDDYVSFRGKTEDVIKEMLNSSIYVMTSRFEGLPMVLIEAQIMGLPIVSFDCPEGPADIVNEDNGFLVELGNIGDFSKRVIQIANDDVLRKNLGKNAKKNSTRFNNQSIYLLWDDLLTNGLEKE